MRVALSADLHLTRMALHPERYHALEQILAVMSEAGIRTLIMAGDTFDETSRNYGEFDSFCTREPYKEIRFIVLPGNHDSKLSQDMITAPNVEIVEEPKTIKFSDTSLTFALLPYMEGKPMGEAIACVGAHLTTERWVLVGHGDWIEGMHEPNPDEPGVYMPLTRGDLENFRPCKALLGHIHKPMDTEVVHYAGSPCGLDIRETGRRRFLVIDTNSGTVEPHHVKTDFLYFKETFIVLPLTDEISHVESQIATRIAGWQLNSEEIPKVRLLTRFRGYTNNKKQLQETIQRSLADFTCYKDTEPDLSEVSLADDPNRSEIARRVSEHIRKMETVESDFDVDSEEVLLEALNVIYGE